MESSADVPGNKPAEPESQATDSSGRLPTAATKATHIFMIDFVLRVSLFISTLIAMVVMTTSEQTVVIQDPFSGFYEYLPPAKFSYSPAFVYFVVAVTLACSYSAITTLLTLYLPSSNKLAFYHGLLDALMLGMVASATGTAGGVAYIGLNGNNHAGWLKICYVYDTFCKHLASAIAFSLIASVLLLLLVMLSMCSAYKHQQLSRC